MTPFLEYLSDKKLPGFAMLKNARLVFNSADGYLIKSYEQAFWSESIDELRAMIPVAHIVQNKEAIEQARFRFGEDFQSLTNFRFDDQPNSLLNESSDLVVFGESWVIFWVVPMDKAYVIQLILERLEENSEEKIQPEQIKNAWDECVNRIFFKHSGEQDSMELALIHEELLDELIEKVNQSPKAPDESAWDVLDEEKFLWDQDEEED